MSTLMAPAPMFTGTEVSPPAAASALSMEIVSTVGALDALQSDWDALFDRSPAAAAPLHFVWVRQWWRVFGNVYGDAGRGLRVICFRRGSRLVGVLPLYLQRAAGPLHLRRLRFISTGAAEFEETCAEYLGLLHASGEEADCVALLARTLLNPPPLLQWDELRLDDMADDSPLLELAERLSNAGTMRQQSPGVAYLSNMAGGLESYLMRLSPGTRKKARKFLRDLQAPHLSFEIAATAEQAGEFFEQMVELHRERWRRDGKTGSFSARHALFHRTVAVSLAPRGQALLARLCDNGRPVAFAYGYRVGDRFEAYQMGVTRDPCSLRSPGTVVFLGLASHLAGEGVTTYDHLMGNNRFKVDYAKDERAIRTLVVERSTVRMSLASTVTAWLARGQGLARSARGWMRPTPRAAETAPASEEES